jgi:hypothetical protein
MPTYTSEDIKLMEEFKQIALKIAIEELKSCTSWRLKDNFRYTFKEYGWTGPFTYFAKYYVDREYEFLDLIELLWDEVD